jgi:hypothetical protein
MEPSLPSWLDLASRISCLGYDMEDLMAKKKTCKNRIAKKILMMKLEALRLEHRALVEQYNNGKYINDTDNSVMDDDEMANAAGAIEACYDI